MSDSMLNIKHINYINNQISIIKNKMILCDNEAKKTFYRDQIEALQSTLENIKKW